MAPAPLSKARPKSKLSQTRLKTPQKPTASTKTSATPFSASTSKNGSVATKTKGKPNQSILSFFKKAPAPDEELFIGGNGVNGLGNGTPEGDLKEEEDIYGASPSRDGVEEEEGRYNELGGSVKRRRVNSVSPSRLSPSSELGNARGNEGPATEAKVDGAQNTVVEGGHKGNKTAAPKRKPGNPFLDDSSDDEDEDSGGKRNEPAAPSVPMVRTPQPIFDDFHGGNGGRGPEELTNEAAISRVPLLRHETSGADVRGSSPGRNGGEISNEAKPFEDDDFTGEELQAMRYMEEQARLEAEEAGEEYEVNEFAVEDGTMTESCPVCNGSLAGVTPEQATTHVNSCLDGNPTPLPESSGPPPPPPGEAVEVEVATVGKRFAKAAVARPGQANPISLGTETGQGKSTSAFTKLMSGHAEDAAWATAAAAETASRGMPAYKRTCPFYKIMPGFSICVDAFRYGAVEGCRAYFLSHFHSDHYIGLTANWTHGPIYCSKVTGSLVKSQLKTAAKYVVELEFEETVPVPNTNGVVVTMIPANHCPGSSLFLFEKTAGGKTQRILHCGDFRACPAHIEHEKLRPETVDAISGRTKQQKIDVCYLDTTYLNPRYSFPPQNDVITTCADLCALLNKGLLENDDRHWESLLRRQRGGEAAKTKDVSKFFTTSSTTSTSSDTTPPPLPNNAFSALNGRRHNPNRLLVVCGTYSIGKERICVAIAQALRSKIYASPAKIRMCKQLDDPELSDLLTSNPAEAQVHMQMLMEIRAETLAEYLEGYKARGEFSRIVGFRPSGWNYRPAPSSSASSSSSIPTPTTASTINANLPPTSLPTTHLLHHPHWRTRFTAQHLVPQRGGTAQALCFGAPYSEHSSFRELALFVMALRIERIVPTVNVGSEASRRRMKGWLDKWVAERRKGGVLRVFRECEGSKGGDKGGKGVRDEELWDGKDGRGGGVYW